MTNETISVAEAKKRLSELLGRVAFGGEEFTIARRGRPVARLVSIERDAPHLADVRGWLPDNDVFFDKIDRIVANRARNLPRVSKPRRSRREG
jgi:prevent-host-death family protein